MVSTTEHWVQNRLIGHIINIIDAQKSFSWYIRFVTQSKSHSPSHLHRLVHGKIVFLHLQQPLTPVQ